jgi:CRISPR-associated endonuclease/helicase Cas3
MPKIDQATKADRKERVFLTLRRHPLGLSVTELSEITGFERRTLDNYLLELEREGKVYKEEKSTLWVALPWEQTQLRKFELSPEEAMTLYLAARLFTKQHDKRNEPAETALMKLATALVGDARIGGEIQQAALELSHRPDDGRYNRAFRAIMQGYIYRHIVRLTYEPATGSPFTTDFAPYLLEPSAIGFTTYAIGHSSIVSKLRTYKLERIREATLTRQEYSIPSDFRGLDVLRSAWSIIYGEELVTVVLRFSPNVRKRVMETRWHPSETKEDDPERPDHLRWSAQVADTLDMLPWVKGWGADVEVLAPKELREKLADTAKDLSLQYQVSQQMQTPAYLLLWAKADKKTDDYHLLLYHMIDVGYVALELWQTGLNAGLRRQIAEWLGLGMDDAGRLIAFLASLHDLGKASPAFQDHPYLPPNLRARIERQLRATGFEISPRPDDEKRARHEVISTYALKNEGLLVEQTTFPQSHIDLIAQMLGGHHGAWPQSVLFSPAHLKPADKGGDQWVVARQSLFQELRRIFQPPVTVNVQPDTLKDNVMLTLISGIVSVADWIGSAEENFPYEKNVLPLDSYVRHSCQHARYALLRMEWRSAPAMPFFDFEKTFGFSPRLAQQQVSDALKSVKLPALAIIEAPMGSGKTEAAIAVYAQWAKVTGNSGLYVAMPTTATSNQMHSRVAEFLSIQLGKDIEPLLVHSQALLRELPAENETVEEDDEGYQATAQAWFLPRKRSLLVPFGVGTVDQALMSVLQTKHFFVRLLGLSHKVVIFDEVHAYDAYMSELFERLLIWLRQINVSVIVLSATLPDKTRQRLIEAFAGEDAVAPPKVYPRLTFATADGRPPDAIELASPNAKTLQFEWIDRDETSILERLAGELREGGCAVVICNTVGRAQKLYDILSKREEKLCDDDNLILFHARFPMAWREELEQKVLKKFGPNIQDKCKPNSDRPSKAIVIATQVVEQSLDLDFDVMVSDHAPIDLLLQRAGRLQRHSINEPRRHPYRLLITAPEVDDGLPKFEGSETFVYDEYVLLRSWVVLSQIATKQILLPTNLPALIEQVYGDAEPTDDSKLLSALAKAKGEMTKKQIEAEDLAEERMVREPSFRRLLYQPNMQLEEDDERVHKAFRALTRDGDPGLQVVCLHRVDDKLLVDPDQPQMVYDLSQKLSSKMIRELARRTINVRHPDPSVGQSLLTDLGDAQIKSILTQWKRIAALRYHRVVIFENGVRRLPSTRYVMRLSKDDRLGLQIYKGVQ